MIDVTNYYHERKNETTFLMKRSTGLDAGQRIYRVIGSGWRFRNTA